MSTEVMAPPNAIPVLATGHRIPTERSFGLSIGAICLAAGAWSAWLGRVWIGAVCTTVGAVLVGVGLLAPAILRIPNRVWWRLAQALAWVNARIILTLFFVLVLTPVGVAMRLCGRNALKAQAHPGSNWSSYIARRRDPRHYEHSF